MRVHVALTPDEAGAAPTGIVIDVIRATTTMCQALASGYERVFCAAEVEEAQALREELGEGVLGGERNAVRIPGFDLGNSPREYLEPAGRTLILSTTNGTRAVVSAAQRCERVLVASLLNLVAVVEAARVADEDVIVVCAGVQGALALDDAYVAGRIVELLDWERSDAAEAAVRLMSTWSGAEVAFRASKSGRNLLENAPELEDDIAFCARESVLDIVPRLAALRGGAAEIVG
ncbi:MAG: 2-phosphosulfolactate phosphatase [Actinomycetota bacterium]|nr:2-phosphosulfolactate phosphatase [Actinomycetota bacterium]